LARAVKALEARISQLVQAHDEQRASFSRFLFTVGFVVCFGVIAAVGYTIFNQYVSRNEPPRLNSFVPVPVQVGDKTVLLGVGVAQWEVPPELNAAMIEVERRHQEEERKRAAGKDKPEAGRKNPPAAGDAPVKSEGQP
jgi:hypothetical protein